MIGRVTDRTTFSGLAAAPVVRRGPVRIRFVPAAVPASSGRDEAPVARVAFAIGKPVGNAVIRNRVRRRLRAALTEVDRARPDGLPAGAYLVGADRSVAQLRFTELLEVVSAAVAATHRGSPSPRAGAR